MRGSRRLGPWFSVVASLLALRIAYAETAAGSSATPPTDARPAPGAPQPPSAQPTPDTPTASPTPSSSAASAASSASPSATAEAEGAPLPGAPADGSPTPSAPGAVTAELTSELERLLREAADDLDLDVSYLAATSEQAVDEETLLANAAKGYAIGAELYADGDHWRLRLSVVRPGEATISVSRTTVSRDNIEVKAIRSLQALVEQRTAPSKKQTAPAAQAAPEKEPWSSGRALLTAHGALVGGYLGFSLEHMAGAGDARLVYPLMTLGAGAGVGASLVIAEEWDISSAEAWYIWAAGTWSTVAGRVVATSAGGSREQRYGYSLLGTAVGLTLGTVGLNSGEVSGGGALLTHSGAVFGAHFGGLGHMLARGSTAIDPGLGVGIGLGSGLLIAGALAPQVGNLSSSRVLFIDVSAILGGLAGAALASPILVGEELSAGESRIWLGSIALGTVTGAVVGTLLTQESSPRMFGFTPYFDVVAPLSTRSNGGTPVVGVAGAF